MSVYATKMFCPIGEREKERGYHTVIANIKTQAYIVTGACVQHINLKKNFNRITGMCVCVCTRIFLA